MPGFPLLLALVVNSSAQDAAPVVPLWTNGAPGFESRRNEPEQAKDWWVKNIHNPSLTVFLPPKEKANGTAVVIIPGGGHSQLVFGAEGTQPAKYLNGLGIACFVLKHRLAREANSPYKIEVHARQDMERAMRLVRARAIEWGVNPKRLGVLGFSAGGETAAFVSYADLPGETGAADPIDRQNARADFSMIVYPGPIGFPKTVPPDAPPAFMVCSWDDESHARVLEEILPQYRTAKVPIEMHLYAKGGHGYNMGERSKLSTIRGWPQRMADWLADMGYLAK